MNMIQESIDDRIGLIFGKISLMCFILTDNTSEQICLVCKTINNNYQIKIHILIKEV